MRQNWRARGAVSLVSLVAAAAMLMGCESLEQTVLVGLQIAEVSVDLVEEEDRSTVLSGLRAARAMVEDVDTAEEIAIGQSLAARTFASFGEPYDDPALTRYVARVGKLVALQSDRPSLPFSFAVVENERPNALALPGGYVFVSTGLLKRLGSESELAAILGHEIAHVAEKHGLEVTLRDRRISSLIDFAQELDEDMEEYRQFIDLAYEKLAHEGYDQRYEIRADLAGTRYAYRAGYHPEGLLPFLQESARLGNRLTFEVFKTHPDSRRRMEKIRGHLGTLGDYSGFPRLQDRYRRQVLARLR